MTKYILKYLDTNFYVKENVVYTCADTIILSTTLSKELELIFGLKRKVLKFFIKKWLLSKNANFPFKRYWNITVKPNTFNSEMIQDLQGYYGIDIVAELEATLVREIEAEIRSNVMNNLMAAVGDFNVNYNQENRIVTVNVQLPARVEYIEHEITIFPTNQNEAINP